MSIHVEMHMLLLNVFVMIESWHFMCTQVGSSPCRRIPLLGIAHLVVGKCFLGAGGTPRGGTHLRS